MTAPSMETFPSAQGAELPDVQKTPDTRNIPIDRVGVRGVRYPISVLDRSSQRQHTIGDFTLTVDLPSEFKGTHMSRFLEALNEHEGGISVEKLPDLLACLRERLDARRAHVRVRFPYFIAKKAPVTGREGLMPFDCGFDAESDGAYRERLWVKVPVATLCPCSREISDRGAHNQRGWVTASLEAQGHLWLEEVIEMIEGAASSPLYPILKRPDEKRVTEQAYDNPRFVEDMVREVAIAFDREPRILRYDIEVENEESIHVHNACASLSRP